MSSRLLGSVLAYVCGHTYNKRTQVPHISKLVAAAAHSDLAAHMSVTVLAMQADCQIAEAAS